MCERCLLTTLDVSKNTALTELYCGRNKLTALDVSKNTALTKLVLHNNEFSADALNDLFDILPSNKGNKTVYIGRNPGTDACNRTIAEDKGWIVETTGDYE
jgi:Leucine-rich repeat (LRR) protein